MGFQKKPRPGYDEKICVELKEHFTQVFRRSIDEKTRVVFGNKPSGLGYSQRQRIFERNGNREKKNEFRII